MVTGEGAKHSLPTSRNKSKHHIKVKTHSIICFILCALFYVGIVAPAAAGRRPHETYTPITTKKQVESIEPRTRMDIEWPNCGMIKTMIVGEDPFYLHGFTCDTCKTKFVVRSDVHGVIRGAYVCTNDASHKAKLSASL